MALAAEKLGIAQLAVLKNLQPSLDPLHRGALAALQPQNSAGLSMAQTALKESWEAGRADSAAEECVQKPGESVFSCSERGEQMYRRGSGF